MTDDIKKAPENDNTSPEQADSKPDQVETNVQEDVQAPQQEQPEQTTVADENSPMEPEQHPHTKPKKDNHTTLAIVLAVLVSLLIIGLGYVALSSSVDEIEEPANTTQPATSEQQEALPPVDQTDLDEELNQLEAEADGLGDGSEFSEGELSDESLELQ